MRAVAVHRPAPAEELVGRVLCHDVRSAADAIVFRKGHAITAADVPRLMDAAWTELHLLELGPDDVGQREAGRRLVESLAGPDLAPVPAGHRHVLKAKLRGMVKVDAPALHRLNSVPGVAVFTLRDGSVTSADHVVAEAQITPLAIARETLEQAEAMAGPVVRVLPFAPREVVIFTRDDRMPRPLVEELQWFGCSVRGVIDLPRDTASIGRAMGEQLDADLFIVAGANALDPLDPIFVALEQLGATMQRKGVPVHPGTLLWLASLGRVTMIGLPSCGLGRQLTGFDLILPRLLAEGSIADDELAALGHGGILSGARR